jgi:hypothetical protein
MASTTSESTADFPRGRRVRVRQDQSVGPAGTRIEVLEPAGHLNRFGGQIRGLEESLGFRRHRAGVTVATTIGASSTPRLNSAAHRD